MSVATVATLNIRAKLVASLSSGEKRLLLHPHHDILNAQTSMIYVSFANVCIAQWAKRISAQNNETTGMDVVHEVKYYEVRKTSMGA